jgi:hypothetical protein
MEQLVDAVAAVSLYDATFSFSCDGFDDSAVGAEQCTGLDCRNGGIECITRTFHNSDVVRIGKCLVADVVRLVQIAMESTVVKCDVDVDNVAILKRSVVRNSVADDFIDRGADGFGEVAVIEGRGVGL